MIATVLAEPNLANVTRSTTSRQWSNAPAIWTGVSTSQQRQRLESDTGSALTDRRTKSPHSFEITDAARAGVADVLHIAQYGSTRSINAGAAAAIAMHAWIARHAGPPP